jgi:hypothetical protein
MKKRGAWRVFSSACLPLGDDGESGRTADFAMKRKSRAIVRREAVEANERSVRIALH